MSGEDQNNKTSGNAQETRAGIKRRDVLLSGSSALAASALAAASTPIGLAQAQETSAAPDYQLGEVLPIMPPKQPPITEPDWRKVPAPPRFEVKPPKDAPNVVIVLMDQACYADPSGMGGPINTPTFDRLAAGGLKYVNFHVCPLCSPSRTALLTGRNAHQNSMAGVAGTAGPYPGDTSVRPRSISTIGTILQNWGYCTSYFGKCNEVPEYQVSVSGPFDLWPTRVGFDKFYGYIAGEQSSFNPNLIDGTTFIGRPRDPNYHFNTDLTDEAVAWIQATRSLTPERPFLMYYAQSACHPPHTPPPSWLKKDLYKGKFDQGWDALREEILARQIKMDIVPPGTKLAANPDSIKKWETLSADEKKVFSRQMEVYATLTEHADYEVGRLVQGIEDLGIMDNTLFIYIFGDNGGSIVGDVNGCFVEWSKPNDAPEDVPYLPSRLDEYGGPRSYPNYAVGWAMAGATPATWAITMAHGGGNNAGMVLHWPNGIKAKGEIRPQYTSLIDIVPTILEAASCLQRNCAEAKSIIGSLASIRRAL
jgi:arylsulfatase A-like enzyme